MDTLHTINHLVQRLSYDLRCLHPRNQSTSTEKEKYAALEMLSTTNHAIKVLLDKLRLELSSSTEPLTGVGLVTSVTSQDKQCSLQPAPQSPRTFWNGELWLGQKRSPSIHSTTTPSLKPLFDRADTLIQEELDRM